MAKKKEEKGRVSKLSQTRWYHGLDHKLIKELEDTNLTHQSSINSDRSSVSKVKRSCYLQLSVVSLSFVLVYSAFFSLGELQGSWRSEKTLNFYNDVAFAGCAALSGLTLTPILTSALSPKVALLLGWQVHLVHILVNFYPRFYTTLPASALLGIATPVIWTSYALFISELSLRLSSVSRRSHDVIFRTFNAIFQFVFTLSLLSSSIVSLTILDKFRHYITAVPSSVTTNSSTATNISLELAALNQSSSAVNQSAVALNSTGCRRMTCPLVTRPLPVSSPPPWVVFVFLVSCIMCNLLGTLSICALPNIRPQRRTSTASRMRGACQLLCDVKLLCMVAPIMCVGASSILLSTIFREALMTCVKTAFSVGLLTLTFSVAYSAGCLASAVFSLCLRRFFHLLPAFLICGAAPLTWLLIDSAHEAALLVPLGSLGVAVGMLQVQLFPLVSEVLGEQRAPAFAHVATHYAAGRLVMAAVPVVLCFYQKVLLYCGLAVFAAITYLVLELILRRRNKLDDTVAEEELQHMTRNLEWNMRHK